MAPAGPRACCQAQVSSRVSRCGFELLARTAGLHGAVELQLDPGVDGYARMNRQHGVLGGPLSRARSGVWSMNLGRIPRFDFWYGVGCGVMRGPL